MTQAVRSILLAMILAAMAGPASAANGKLVKVQTPRGVELAFILIEPVNPVASAILFAGGSGALGLTGPSTMHWRAGNFLVRTRQMFATRGLAVAVVDAPSDHQNGMSATFRMSNAHATDIGAVVADLKKRKALPVWLIGTSMGTYSAARGAIAGNSVDGLVLTSTITQAPPQRKIASGPRDGVASMDLDRIAVPTLIVSHRHDRCGATPPAGIKKLKNRLTRAGKVEIVMLDGGYAPRSQPCQAKSQHGFFGIEAKAVDAIVKFIKANSH